MSNTTGEELYERVKKVVKLRQDPTTADYYGFDIEEGLMREHFPDLLATGWDLPFLLQLFSRYSQDVWAKHRYHLERLRSLYMEEERAERRKQLPPRNKAGKDPRATINLSGVVSEHPVAKIFPLIAGAEFDELKADIESNGLREPVWVYRDQIVDGRNRYRACRELGWTSVPAREWDGKGSLIGFVVSLNLKRRHLTSSRRAAVAVDMLPFLASEAKDRKREGGAEGGKRSGETRRGEAPQTKDCQFSDSPSPPAEPARAEELAARAANTNRDYVHQAKALKEKAPKLLERVRAGEITVGKATAEMRRTEVRELRKQAGVLVDSSHDAAAATAYHEAGHAVAGYLLGAGVELVTIRPTKGRKGKSRGDERVSASVGHVEHARNVPHPWGSVLYMAGEVAEQQYWDNEHGAGAGGDRRQVADKLYQLRHDGVARYVGGPDARGCSAGDEETVTWSDRTQRHYRDWLRSMTRDLLEKHDVWQAVHALAVKLLEVKELAGGDAEELIARWVRPAPQPPPDES